ncbi:MAG: cytochrome c peroxidase [Gammaproteobacteria bacterium]|nr:cytochrome c peroxidase [Gammaproteobacteria bacterium]
MGSVTGSMGFEEQEDILEVMSDHGYAKRFEAAFPDAGEAMTVEHYGEALEAYQRSLRTPGPFDAWLGDDDDAMDDRQKAGLARFLNTGCAGCHNGPLLGGNSLQKFGMVADYWEHTGTETPHEGRMTVTGNESDRYVFRVSPLRGVAETAPYFHDASVESLDEAVQIMARVQLGQDLSEQATAELVSFLRALTGDMPAHFSAPEGIPFELPPGVAAP